MRRIAGVAILSTALAFTVAGLALHGGDVTKNNFAQGSVTAKWVGPPAVAALPYCVNEDGSGAGQQFPCRWDAHLQGNGQGDSTVVAASPAGSGVVLDHAQMWGVLRDDLASITHAWAAGESPSAYFGMSDPAEVLASDRMIIARLDRWQPYTTAEQPAVDEMNYAVRGLLDAEATPDLSDPHEVERYWDAFSGAYDAYLGA